MSKNPFSNVNLTSPKESFLVEDREVSGNILTSAAQQLESFKARPYQSDRKNNKEAFKNTVLNAGSNRNSQTSEQVFPLYSTRTDTSISWDQQSKLNPKIPIPDIKNSRLFDQNATDKEPLDKICQGRQTGNFSREKTEKILQKMSENPLTDLANLKIGPLHVRVENPNCKDMKTQDNVHYFEGNSEKVVENLSNNGENMDVDEETSQETVENFQINNTGNDNIGPVEVYEETDDENEEETAKLPRNQFKNDMKFGKMIPIFGRRFIDVNEHFINFKGNGSLHENYLILTHMSNKLVWEQFVKYVEQISLQAKLNEAETILQTISLIKHFCENKNLLEGSDSFQILKNRGLEKFIVNNYENFFNVISNFSKTFEYLIPLLRKGENKTIIMTKWQAYCILVNAFFCMIPDKISKDFPDINFFRIFHQDTAYNPRDNSKKEKLKCIFNYFDRMSQRNPFESRYISFERRAIPQNKIPNWEISDKYILDVEVRLTGKIEECKGMLQVDFANKYIGGGVLGNGCVMEEILFVIFPELIVSMAFSEKLDDNETIIIKGVEQFSSYSGYGSSFQFSGDFQENHLEIDSFGRIDTEIVAMDALHFRGNKFDQFQLRNIERELLKCFCAFNDPQEEEKNSPNKPIATGNWGCGVFNGDIELKFLIQIMAASVANRTKLVFHTFGDRSQEKSIKEICKIFKEHGTTVGELFKLTKLYYFEVQNKNWNPANGSIFDFIKNNLTTKKQTGVEATRNLLYFEENCESNGSTKPTSISNNNYKLLKYQSELSNHGSIKQISPEMLSNINLYIANSSPSHLKYHISEYCEFKPEIKYEKEPHTEMIRNSEYKMLLWGDLRLKDISSLFDNSAKKGQKMYKFFDRIHPLMNNNGPLTSGDKIVAVLYEVSLGNVYKSPHGFDYWKLNFPPPEQYDCVKGCGRFIPDWSGNGKTTTTTTGNISNTIIPYGQTRRDRRFSNYNLSGNEYIIYDRKRIKIAYLVEIIVC